MITIYTKTHRESCLYGLGVEDKKVYDSKIDEYFQYLVEEGLKEGIEVRLNNDTADGCLSYSIVTDVGSIVKEHGFIRWNVKSFWGWLN